MTLRTRVLVLICPLFLASMQLIGSEVKPVTSAKQLNASLFTAIKDANIDQIRALLGNNADIEAKSKHFGYTPLIKAARDGHTEVCNLLIEMGADIEAKNWSGYTPLMKAAHNGHTEVCKLLIKKGADINATFNNGDTPLIWAASNGRTEVCMLLIEKGADINAKSNDGWTPLIWAASNGLTEVCMLLIEKGADIEAKDNDGYTLLICAVSSGFVEVCELLIDKDADIEARDKCGYTPLIWAAVRGHTEICQLLIERMLLQPIIKNRGLGACIQKLKEVLLVFNRRRIPKDIRPMILCGTPELEVDLLYVLYNAHKRGKNISQEYMNILKARWPQMVHQICQKENLETVEKILTNAQSKARTEALRALLDPSTLESRILEILGL